VACNDDINLGVQVVEETMQNYPDLDGWFFVGLWPIFAGQGAMPLFEGAVTENGMIAIAFDTLPVELEWLQAGLVHGLVGQKYWGWGYDTVYMVYDKIVNGVEYESWTDSGMDIVTINNVEAMATAWDTQDFTQSLPPAYPPEDGTLTIAWIPKALNNPVFELGHTGCETAAAELTEMGPYEVVCEYMGSVESDMAEQAGVMADAVAQGVDAIGVSCNSDAGCVDPINTAIEAGIPVMTWDSDSPESTRFTYLGVSNYEGGRAAAELLVREMGEEGRVALLTGVPGAPNLEERISGFEDYVADYPGIEIVTTVACNDDINLGVQVVEETMQNYPDLNGWFFVGLWPVFAGQGAMPLFEGAVTENGMIAIAFDTLEVELEWLEAGLLHGLVGQKYWGWGYDTVYMVYDHLLYATPYDSWTDSGMDIVTINNVEAMAEAWATQDFTQPLPPAYPEE
jgi:ribose transport system substrate-binding protein